MFNSPYHYRLDWETWIRVTASLEHLVGQWREKQQRDGAGALLDIPLPGIHTKLITQILNGDTGAMNLMGTSMADLLQPNASCVERTESAERAESAGGVTKTASRVCFRSPPTAVRAEFYSYTFSSPEDLREKGVWWDRERMSRPQVIEAELRGETHRRRGEATGGGERRTSVRRTPWQRHWVLFFAAVGLFLPLRTLVGILVPLLDGSAFLLVFPTWGTWGTWGRQHRRRSKQPKQPKQKEPTTSIESSMAVRALSALGGCVWSLGWVAVFSILVGVVLAADYPTFAANMYKRLYANESLVRLMGRQGYTRFLLPSMPAPESEEGMALTGYAVAAWTSCALLYTVLLLLLTAAAMHVGAVLLTKDQRLFPLPSLVASGGVVSMVGMVGLLVVASLLATGAQQIYAEAP
jgi:hypothetical protein